MNNLELSSCASKPIRFPDAIQPHGALLVLESNSGLIGAASESCETLLGLSAQQLLGQTMSKIFGIEVEDEILQGQHNKQQTLLNLSGANEEKLIACASVNAAGQVLVDIEVGDPAPNSERKMLNQYRQGINELRSLREITAITQQATQLVREMTDLDRVMFYRFDENWNGEVIAEAHDKNIMPYLGLNFPAGDIPKQARDLLLTSKIRQIPDTHYHPSQLIKRENIHSIDLGFSILRSTSHFHIEFLKNMGVRATFVASIIIEGRLWGLLSCHHINGPKYIFPEARNILGWLCEDIAAHIEAMLIRQKQECKYQLALLRRNLVNTVRAIDIKTLIKYGAHTNLLQVVGADGFALIIDNTIETMGKTPSHERIWELLKLRCEIGKNPTFFSTNSLIRDLGLGDDHNNVAGALFVSVQQISNIYLIWFRVNRHQTVRWGADPNNPHITDNNGRISPRKSFEQFLVEVDGQCLSWSVEELDSAAELGSLIEIEEQKKQMAFAQTIFNSFPEHIAVLDKKGEIKAVNTAWKRFAQDANAHRLANNSVGLNYRTICETATAQPDDIDAMTAWQGIETVINKKSNTFTFEYSCNAPNRKRWFRMRVYPMIEPNEGVVVAHENITNQKLMLEALRQSAQKFRSYFDHSIVGISITSINKSWIEVNQYLCDILGYSRDELVCLNWLDITHPDDIEISIIEFNRIIKGETEGYFLEKRYISKNKNIVYVALSVRCIRKVNGTIDYFLTLIQDITDKKYFENALERESQKNLILLRNASDGIHILDTKGYVIEASDSFCAMLGYSREELFGMHVSQWDAELSSTEIALKFKQFFEKRERIQFETRHRRKDGSIFFVEISAYSLITDGRPVLFNSSRDITERKLANAALIEAHEKLEKRVIERTEQLRQLAVTATLAEERERQAIARDLHDNLGQTLHVVKIKIDSLAKKVSDDSKYSVIELNDLIYNASRLVRSLTSQLSPTILENMGLGPALHWLGDELKRHYNIDVEMNIEELPVSLSNIESIILYRAVRELLINVAKHAQSNHAKVDLFCRDHCLILTVEDNGVGIDNVDTLFSSTKGFGLSSVRERITYLGGHLELTSKAQEGFRSRLKMPLKQS